MESFSTQDGTYTVPPVINPPQHVFGDYGSDSPPQNYYSGTYSADNDMQLGVDENGDPKRRRIARACDMCRKKKIKCDGKMPACSHCENSKTECIFTQVEKKRNPPKGAKYIEGLENRLKRMESLLELSGLIGEEDEGTDLGTLERRLADKAMSNHNSSNAGTPTKSPGVPESVGNSETLEPQQDSHQHERRPSTKGSLASPKPQQRQAEKKEREGEVEALSDMMCSLVTNNVGETRYIGSSSGFSIFSPKGIQWVNEKTGDNSFQHRMTEANQDDSNSKSTSWNPEIFGDIFARRVFRQLPPLNEALSLLKDFFENFNCMFPLFHEPTFMHLVHRQYSRDPYEGSGWWASLNCALAIAHRLRVMSNLVPQEEDQKAWGFLKNALGVLAELTMRNTDLLSVQALLGMALFLLGTQNPQPSFLLVAAATRLAHSIGLHKRGSTFNLNPVEVEQRKRVFWIAYLLDKDMCLRSGRPPAQDDNDMNVELPSEDPGDNIGNIPLADGKGKTNLFRLMCTFAIIEGKVYKELYSTKASRFSDGELLNNIGELDRELEEWKDGIPADFRPENEIKASHTPLIIHVVMLHFAYYNCLQTIHRMSVHHGYWTSRLSNYAIQGLNARPLNPRVFSSATICVQAARSTIQLLKYIPQGDYACVWMIIYYPVSALMTLFTNVLQNPQDARARSDIRLMHQVVSFSSTLTSNEEGGGVKRMLEVCIEFERIAKIVVDKSDKESHSRRKRKNANAEGEDDVAQTLAPEKRQQTPGSLHHTTPQAQHTPAPSTGLTPGFTGPGADLLSQPFSPASTINSGLPSSPATVAAAATTVGLSSIDPTSGSTVLPNYVPQPGDFPNMFTEFTDINNFGAPGLGSPSLGGAGVAGDTAGFNGQFVPQELWQMPMGLDWEEWPGMQGDPTFTADGGAQQQVS